jgi:hypothetical protein
MKGLLLRIWHFETSSPWVWVPLWILAILLVNDILA